MDLLQGVLKGLRPAVVALIASAGGGIMVSALNIGGEGRIKLQMAVIFAICLALLRKKWKPHSGDGTGRCHAGDLRIYNDVDGNIDR